MTSAIGPPAAPPVTSIERAKMIIARALDETSAEMIRPQTGTGQKQTRTPETPRAETPSPSRDITAEARRLPPDLAAQPVPQRVEGRITAIEGQYVRIETDKGTVEVRTPEARNLQVGQDIEIRIPPETEKGAPVTLRPLPPRQDTPAYSPPPQSDSTRDYPPVRVHDTLLATPRPIQDYVVPRLTADAPPARIFTPQSLAAAVENMAFRAPSGESAAPLRFPPPLMALAAFIKFSPQQLDALTARPSVPPPYGLKIQPPVLLQPPGPQAALGITPVNTENLLTQAPLHPTAPHLTGKPAAQAPNMARSLLDTQIQAGTGLAVPMAEKPPAFHPFLTPPQGAGTSSLLKSFTQLEVLALFPKATPMAEMQQTISASLQKSAPLAVKGAPASPAPAGPSVSLATVVGATPAGQTVISVPPPLGFDAAPPALFYISTPVFAPVGSQLLVGLSDMPLSQVAETPAALQSLPAGLQNAISPGVQAGLLPQPLLAPAYSAGWPALEEALHSLSSAGPQNAQALQNILPTPTPRLVPTALFFMAALQLGTLENWMGDRNLNALRGLGKKGLVDRLAGDFGRLSAQAAEKTAGQWKTITFPLFHESEISNIQLHVRSDDRRPSEQEDENAPETAKTRFLLDLTLSRLGPMQIDGYLTPKTLDMILRTDQRLAETARRDLMRIFAQTAESVGLQGSLIFQNHAETRVKINDKSKSY